MDAIVESPWGASQDISGYKFAPASEVIRLTEGSNNWPITWAADDILYRLRAMAGGLHPLPGSS